MIHGYESFFGLAERPFSLTPDPRYFFKSRSHLRAIETLVSAMCRRERLLLVNGDLGLGKTVLCRRLTQLLRRRRLVSLIANPLLTAEGVFRLILEDFGAAYRDLARVGRAANGTAGELQKQLVQFLSGLQGDPDRAVIIIDQAHTVPAAIVEELLAIRHKRKKLLQVILVGYVSPDEPGTLDLGALGERISANARLQPLGRQECGAYVKHRLATAGGSATTSFTPGAIETLHELSGGVPRLVNLLCEQALQEGASRKTQTIEPPVIEAASSVLEQLGSRRRPFRWFTQRVS